MDVMPRRILVSYAPPEAFAPMSRVILAKLGYVIVDPEEFEGLAVQGGERPDLRIVDERCLADVPEDDGPSVPIVVLTGTHGVTGADTRIVGALQRPAGMHELYRLAQDVLEDTPRSTPRVPTHLPALCRRNGREWPAALLSLSENGCLLRSPETLLLGSPLGLRFELPGSGPLEVEAMVSYQLVPDLGVVFHAAPTRVRAAIADYVRGALVSAPATRR